MNKEAADRIRENNSEEVPIISPVATTSVQQNEQSTDGAETRQNTPRSTLAKDLFASALCMPVPNHIAGLLKAQKQLEIERQGSTHKMHFRVTSKRNRISSASHSTWTAADALSTSSISLIADTSEPSEESLDVYIPSFPGTPRSLSFEDIDALNNFDPNIMPTESKHTFKVLKEDADILSAAEIDNIEMIERLINENADVKATDLLGRNALHFAVQNGNLRSVELLLKAGIDATIKDDVGMTPLLLGLMRRPSLKIVQLLFDYGAKILPRSSKMDTGIFIQFVMMCTPTEEEEKILRLLVEKGAVVDDQTAPGQRQALHFAAMSNNCELIRILLDLGANPYATNHRKETPRDVAKIFQCKEANALLAAVESGCIYGISSTVI